MTFAAKSYLAAAVIAMSLCTFRQPLSAEVPSVPHAVVVILNRDQAASIFPATVFFRGQSASIQGRNSAGLKLPDGKLVLAALVDTSGYSSALQTAYQAYLLSEVPMMVGGQRLAPGAYGFGFVAGDIVTVMDVGGGEVLHAPSTRDSGFSRPNPLQILPDTLPGTFRLYLGRSYVTLSQAAK